MRYGSRLLFLGLAACLMAPGAPLANAQDEIPLEAGTYARVKDWCKANRADQAGPDYKEKRAYINLTQTEINWDDSVGKITNASVAGKQINLTVQMTTAGNTKAVTLPLTRKSSTLFVLTGVNFYRCDTYMPNPRLGR